eukprot:1354081-Rhodomonas_salina.2
MEPAVAQMSDVAELTRNRPLPLSIHRTLGEIMMMIITSQLKFAAASDSDGVSVHLQVPHGAGRSPHGCRQRYKVLELDISVLRNQPLNLKPQPRESRSQAVANLEVYRDGAVVT